jgi:hypothetical protein
MSRKRDREEPPLLCTKMYLLLFNALDYLLDVIRIISTKTTQNVVVTHSLPPSFPPSLTH